MDYRLARLLAAETVSIPAFATPTEAALHRALELMRRCDQVLLPKGAAIGPNLPLLKQAEALGIPITEEM